MPHVQPRRGDVQVALPPCDLSRWSVPVPFLSSWQRGARRSSGGQRVFAADDGRMWSASLADGASGALLFTCVTDARERPRAIVADDARTQHLADIADEQLRDWLRAAPLLGTLI